jgi:hypothetical protein
MNGYCMCCKHWYCMVNLSKLIQINRFALTTTWCLQCGRKYSMWLWPALPEDDMYNSFLSAQVLTIILIA